MTVKKSVSVVIPTLNEADNIARLFERIRKSMIKADINYEIVLIDDHSDDATMAIARSMASTYNVRAFPKRGQPGKAHSLLQGFEAAQFELVCMIDADLQYPPEAIGPMFKLLVTKNADIVVTERHDNETSKLRKISSKLFNFIFARMLFGISYDTQSGLKLFKKNILNDFEMTPSPWSFDLEFLVRSLENKRKIISYRIPFSERKGGVTKVRLINTTFELAKASIVLRWNTSRQKLKHGHKANARYLKRAFPALAATFFIGGSIIFTPTATAAQPTSIIEEIPVIGQLYNKIKPGNSDTPVTNEPAEAPQVSLPPVTATESSKTPAPVQSTATNESSPTSTTTQTPPSQTTSPQYSPAAVVGNGYFASSYSPPGSIPLRATLASVTASKPSSAYASGYPDTSLTNKSRRTLSIAATSALLMGAGLVALLFVLNSFSYTKSLILQRQR